MSKSMVDISTAAARMGTTPSALRKRIGRGTLHATKQDGQWYVTLSQNSPTVQDVGQDKPHNRPDDNDILTQTLTEELETRRRKVQELHVLLQTTQAETQTLTEELETRRRGVQELHVLMEARRREVQELHVLLQTTQSETQRAYRAGWFPPI